MTMSLLKHPPETLKMADFPTCWSLHRKAEQHFKVQVRLLVVTDDGVLVVHCWCESEMILKLFFL